MWFLKNGGPGSVTSNQRKRSRAFASLAGLGGLMIVAGSLGIGVAPANATGGYGKVTICHWANGHPHSITIDESAVGGHFSGYPEGPKPVPGHEQDTIGACPSPTTTSPPTTPPTSPPTTPPTTPPTSPPTTPPTSPPTTTTTSPPTTTTTSPPTTTTTTVTTSCVGIYPLDPTVGVTTISWTGAPQGARIRIVGYVTEYRDVSESTGELLLPGLPLDQPDLVIDKIYLVDGKGAVLAGPVGLTVCTTTSTATTGTTTGTSTTTGTTTTTGTHTGTGTATSPSKATIAKTPVGPKAKDGELTSSGPNGTFIALGVLLIAAAIGLRRPHHLSITRRGRFER